MKKQLIGLSLLMLLCSLCWAQTQDTEDQRYKQFVGTSAFMLVNLFPLKEPPRFYQMNYGYRFTPKDAIILEAITWQYFAPLGIAYGPSYENPDESFPGIVRDYGIGVAYQRFWWKGLYSTLHATPFLQQYLTQEKRVIQTGFQLFLTGRIGYHLEFFKHRIFVEPSVAFTHWPVNTNMPQAFQEKEDKWPNYFLFEPGLHLGFQF